MTHDNTLTTTYADLLEGAPDPAFTQVIADLDTLAASGEPSTHVDAAIAQALRQRSHHPVTANGAAPLSTQLPTLSSPSASRIPRPASRPRQFAEIAAACLAFALVTLALIAVFRPMDDGNRATVEGTVGVGAPAIETAPVEAPTDEPASDATPSDEAVAGDLPQPINGQIAFVVRTIDESNIFVVNSDGSGERQLTNTPGFNDDPQWSPDGQSIAFASDRNGHFDIYVVNADGSNPRSLTNNPDRDISPRWSPDGQSLVFARFDQLGNSSLMLMNADGSNPRAIASAIQGRGGIWSIAWSPDGSRIAFTQVMHRSSTLYVVNVDGGEKIELGGTDANGMQMNDTDPQWTPDGTRLISIRSSFQGLPALPDVSGTDDWFHGVVLVEADGSGHRVLMNSPDASFSTAVISPDGRHIALVKRVHFEDAAPTNELRIIAIDGSNDRLLSILDDVAVAASWSSDGRWIAMSLQETVDTFSLYRISADGSGLQQISGPHDGWVERPMWAATSAQPSPTTIQTLQPTALPAPPLITANPLPATPTPLAAIQSPIAIALPDILPALETVPVPVSTEAIPSPPPGGGRPTIGLTETQLTCGGQLGTTGYNFETHTTVVLLSRIPGNDTVNIAGTTDVLPNGSFRVNVPIDVLMPWCDPANDPLPPDNERDLNIEVWTVNDANGIPAHTRDPHFVFPAMFAAPPTTSVQGMDAVDAT